MKSFFFSFSTFISRLFSFILNRICVCCFSALLLLLATDAAAGVSDDAFFHRLHNANASTISFQVCRTKRCVIEIKYSYRAYYAKWASLKIKIGYSHIENMCEVGGGRTNWRKWKNCEETNVVMVCDSDVNGPQAIVEQKSYQMLLCSVVNTHRLTHHIATRADHRHVMRNA